MDKDKLVNVDPKAKPESPGSAMETTEANMKLQDAFYDENKSNGVDPANLNSQTAILTDMD